MYIAKKEKKGRLHYFIKETYEAGEALKSRELFDLGSNPARYIKYPGGYSFYIDEAVELTIADKGFEVDTFELQELFWPFIEPGLKSILETFWRRNNKSSFQKRPNRTEMEKLHKGIHTFDKRRLYYCRFRIINRIDISRTSYRFYNRLLHKSRDEIECLITDYENDLKPHEIKNYVFSIFNLQRFFPHNIMAAIAPQALDQEKIEFHFLEELCRLNHDHSFFHGEKMSKGLHDFLIKYLIMFFDNEYGYQGEFNDFMGQFFSGSQASGLPPGGTDSLSPSLTQCYELFGITEKQYKDMTREQLTRVFRKIAHKCHPDKGGDHDRFICICQAYEKLKERKKI
jgi:hypothetical protein